MHASHIAFLYAFPKIDGTAPGGKARKRIRFPRKSIAPNPFSDKLGLCV